MSTACLTILLAGTASATLSKFATAVPPSFLISSTTCSAGEASVRAVDQAVQSLGGNGLTKEYGIAAAVTASRLARIAPVSREMVLNFVAQTSLGLPRSY